MVYHGQVKNGVIVLDDQIRLPDGLRVQVDVSANGVAPPPPLGSLMGTCKGGFKSAEEVDTYLRGLRDESERPWYPKS